jgi:hypothetical protein
LVRWARHRAGNTPRPVAGDWPGRRRVALLQQIDQGAFPARTEAGKPLAGSGGGITVRLAGGKFRLPNLYCGETSPRARD